MIHILTPAIAEPSGGIKVMYDRVDTLNASGNQAAVWHGSEGLAEANPGWPNAVAAVVTSRAIEAFLGRLVPVAFPVHPVPLHVDAQRFHAGVEERRCARRLGDRPARSARHRRGDHPDGHHAWRRAARETLDAWRPNSENGQ